MTTDLQLSKEEAAEFAEFLKTKVIVIDEKISPLMKEKEALLERIAKLTGQTTFSSPAIENARAALTKTLSRVIAQGLPETNIGKIKYVLNEGGNQPMATRQILDKLFMLMPTLMAEKEKVSKNISTVLSINQGDDKIFKRTVDRDGNYLFSINPGK